MFWTIFQFLEATFINWIRKSENSFLQLFIQHYLKRILLFQIAYHFIFIIVVWKVVFEFEFEFWIFSWEMTIISQIQNVINFHIIGNSMKNDCWKSNFPQLWISYFFSIKNIISSDVSCEGMSIDFQSQQAGIFLIFMKNSLAEDLSFFV
jgi:hypothetical protein